MLVRGRGDGLDMHNISSWYSEFHGDFPGYGQTLDETSFTLQSSLSGAVIKDQLFRGLWLHLKFNSWSWISPSLIYRGHLINGFRLCLYVSTEGFIYTNILGRDTVHGLNDFKIKD